MRLDWKKKKTLGNIDHVSCGCVSCGGKFCSQVFILEMFQVYVYMLRSVINTNVECVRYEYGLKGFLLRRIGQWYSSSFRHVWCDDSMSRRMGPLNPARVRGKKWGNAASPAIVKVWVIHKDSPWSNVQWKFIVGLIFTETRKWWDLRKDTWKSVEFPARSVCVPSMQPMNRFVRSSFGIVAIP